MAEQRYIVYTKETEHYDTGNEMPYKRSYCWGVFDTEMSKWLKVYKVPFISLMLATRLAKKLNK